MCWLFPAPAHVSSLVGPLPISALHMSCSTWYSLPSPTLPPLSSYSAPQEILCSQSPYSSVRLRGLSLSRPLRVLSRGLKPHTHVACRLSRLDQLRPPRWPLRPLTAPQHRSSARRQAGPWKSGAETSQSPPAVPGLAAAPGQQVRNHKPVSERGCGGGNDLARQQNAPMSFSVHWRGSPFSVHGRGSRTLPWVGLLCLPLSAFCASQCVGPVCVSLNSY